MTFEQNAAILAEFREMAAQDKSVEDIANEVDMRFSRRELMELNENFMNGGFDEREELVWETLASAM